MSRSHIRPELCCPPGTEVSVTVLNCAESILYGASGDNAWSPTSPELVPAGTWTASEVFSVLIGAEDSEQLFGFSPNIGGTYVQNLTLVSGPLVESPQGDLLSTETITITPTAETFSIQNSNIGFTALDTSTCAMMDGNHSFGTTSVTVTQSGTYTFRVTATGEGTSDPVIGVYTTFNALDPEANLLACNDDSHSNGYLQSDPQTYVNGLYSLVTVDLIPGTYVLMGLTYNANDPVLGWTFTTDQSTTVQMWGPPLHPVEPAALAVTGSPSQVLFVSGLLIVFSGLLALTVSRRIGLQRPFERQF